MVNESQARCGAGLTACCDFTGADARKFLQGQLSNDMALLGAERLTLAGYHNPQGRVLALLRLLAPAPDQVIALLPAELAEPTMTALRRYVLRAKVAITPGVLGRRARRARSAAARCSHRLLDARGTRADIAAGMPQVYGATSGMFVAQMLNLDCVRGDLLHQGLLHRTGNHRARPLPRPHQAPHAALPDAMSPSRSRPGAGRDPERRARGADRRCHRARGWPKRISGGRAHSPCRRPPPPVPPGDRAAGAAQRLSCSPLPLPYALPE